MNEASYPSGLFLQVWDATAADPRLLVFLKAYRNTVPVPRHWCQKRKFLQVCNNLHQPGLESVTLIGKGVEDCTHLGLALKKGGGPKLA